MLNREYAELMAQYNLVMNEKLYGLYGDLPGLLPCAKGLISEVSEAVD
jgi:hypothetical protein